jgi:hypothetical protein
MNNNKNGRIKARLMTPEEFFGHESGIYSIIVGNLVSEQSVLSGNCECERYRFRMMLLDCNKFEYKNSLFPFLRKKRRYGLEADFLIDAMTDERDAFDGYLDYVATENGSAYLHEYDLYTFVNNRINIIGLVNAKTLINKADLALGKMKVTERDTGIDDNVLDYFYNMYMPVFVGGRGSSRFSSSSYITEFEFSEFTDNISLNTGKKTKPEGNTIKFYTLTKRTRQEFVDDLSKFMTKDQIAEMEKGYTGTVTYEN